VELSEAVFDSNILIDHLNNIQMARAAITSYIRPSISIITWMEVMGGAHDNTLARTRTLLEQFALIQITSEIAEAAVTLRRSRKLKLPDAIILATAQVSGQVLVTRNTRDFDATHPSIVVPYSL
jgi:predicted nucleic acid-binding protein